MPIVKRKTWPGSQLRDHKGNILDLTYTNGEAMEIDASTTDYIIDPNEAPIGAFIIPLESGTIEVMLLDHAENESYTYAAEEVDAYIGRPFEGRVRKILANATTVSRIKVVW